MTSLVDTSILICSYDARFPEKRRTATALLRQGIIEDSIRIPHQAVVEFVAVATRPLPTGGSLLTVEEARRQAEEILSEFMVLYPNESILRTALRGAAAYRLGWFDAHLWAYAEYYGLTDLISEDFEHGRLYGSVRAINPFLGAPR